MAGIAPSASAQYNGVPLDPPPSVRHGFGRLHLGRALPLAGGAQGWSLQARRPWGPGPGAEVLQGACEAGGLVACEKRAPEVGAWRRMTAPTVPCMKKFSFTSVVVFWLVSRPVRQGHPDRSRPALAGLAGTARQPRRGRQVVDAAAIPDTGAVHKFCLTATGGPLRVTLAWADRPPAQASGRQLVNDLDLNVNPPPPALSRLCSRCQRTASTARR